MQHLKAEERKKNQQKRLRKNSQGLGRKIVGSQSQQTQHFKEERGGKVQNAAERLCLRTEKGP